MGGESSGSMGKFRHVLMFLYKKNILEHMFLFCDEWYKCWRQRLIRGIFRHVLMFSKVQENVFRCIFLVCSHFCFHNGNSPSQWRHLFNTTALFAISNPLMS